ncbi:MAG: ComF family protein [Nitrospirae bacterium]|nr:ComF family protein [Nitrospirota bacterium]
MRFFRRILDVILPTSCSFCNDPVGDSNIPFFCSACWADFTLIHGPVCPCCGRPFDSPETLTHSPEHVCHECRREPPQFDQALSVGYFEGSLREAVHQFKYRPCRTLGSPLGEWMAANVRLVMDIDLVMPVPLHVSRLKERGFNQALLLAHRMSEAHHIPFSCDNLCRTRPTRPQVELSGVERIRNVAGAFALRQPEVVADRNVVLIDDVFTTGATMNECASVLKQAGAAHVTAFTLARAV